MAVITGDAFGNPLALPQLALVTYLDAGTRLK